MSDYDIAGAFQRIEDELISSMLRNMARHRLEEDKEGFQWSMWQAEELKSLERYKRDNQKKYKKEFKKINNQIRELIQKAKRTGKMQQEIRILQAIQKGYKVHGTNMSPANQALTGEFFKLNERKLEKLIEAIMHDMNKAETAMLRMANDQYRKIIFDAQVFHNSGIGTLEQAIDMAAKDFLSRGINCIEYKNGVRMPIDSYVRMALSTANTRAYLQGESEKRNEWGINTVLVTRRNVACPKCLKWIAKVYYDDVYSGISAPDNKYPKLSTAIAGGLYHPGCKDIHTTYFEGINSPPRPLSQAEKREAGRVYDLQQQQRRNEYNIRKYKRLRDGSLSSENQEKYSAKVKEWQKINKDFIDKNKDVLRRDYKRENSHGIKETPPG